MYNTDGEFVRKVNEEKPDEELAELLSDYPAKKCPWWRVVLSILTVVAVVLMVKAMVGFGEERAKAIFNTTDPMDMLMDEGYLENEAELKFKSEPTHKGYFMQYALEAWRDDKLGVEELLGLAREVDSENALYHYLAAGKEYKDTVDRKKLDKSGMSEREKYHSVKQYEILDEEAFERALEHLIEAGKMGGIVDHTFEIRMGKLADARAKYPQDYIGRTVAIAEAFGVSYYSMRLLDVSSILSVKFYQLSQDGGEAEVMFWKGEFLKVLDTLLKKEGVLVDMLVAKAILSTSLPNMRAAAARVGMVDEVEKVTELLDVLFVERVAVEKRRSAGRGVSQSETAYSKLGLLNELSDGPVSSHLPSDEGLDVEVDPAPGRLVEHALSGRILVTLSFVLIGVLCIGMWIFYGNKSKEMRMMSLQVLASLSFFDGVFVVVGGVILPVLGYVFVNEQTVLGVREWSVTSVAGVLLLIQFGGMLLAVFTLSSVLLRWRLAKRLPEFMKRTRWYQWFIPFASLSAMLLVGFSDSKAEKLPWVISLILLSIACLSWVGISLGQCCFKSDKLARLSLCRGLLSVYAGALILMVGLSFYYHAQEFRYVAQDESFSLKEEHLGLSVLEFNVAEKMRKNLQGQLEMIR